MRSEWESDRLLGLGRVAVTKPHEGMAEPSVRIDILFKSLASVRTDILIKTLSHVLPIELYFDISLIR